MSIKSDKWIREESLLRDMITPFFMDSNNKVVVHGVEKKVPSFGLSSYGYDVRLGSNFKFFRSSSEQMVRNSPASNNPNGFTVNTPIPASTHGKAIDIADFENTCEVFTINDLAWIELPPKSFCLGHTLEKIKMLRDVTAVCMGKSTVARAGIIVTVTPIESEWSGYITLEITNTTDLPVRIYPGMGITQLQFFQSDEQCLVSYADRDGKYQNQAAEPVTAM
jgi:dCTP deaminase